MAMVLYRFFCTLKYAKKGEFSCFLQGIGSIIYLICTMYEISF